MWYIVEVQYVPWGKPARRLSRDLHSDGPSSKLLLHRVPMRRLNVPVYYAGHQGPVCIGHSQMFYVLDLGSAAWQDKTLGFRVPNDATRKVSFPSSSLSPPRPALFLHVIGANSRACPASHWSDDVWASGYASLILSPRSQGLEASRRGLTAVSGTVGRNPLNYCSSTSGKPCKSAARAKVH